MLLACITPACNITYNHLYDPILGYCRQWIDVHWLRNIIGIAQLPKSLKMAHLFMGSVQQINTWFHYVKFIIPTMHCLVGRYFIQKVYIHIYLSYHKGLYSIYKRFVYLLGCHIYPGLLFVVSMSCIWLPRRCIHWIFYDPNALYNGCDN